MTVEDSTEPADRPRRRPALRKAALATGAGLAVGAAAVAAEKYAVRRARSRPDPARSEALAERPGQERRVASFDGTELAVHAVGPKDAPTLVFLHGFSLDLTAWHYQWKHFSETYRCVLYDQRGHGRSAAAAGGDHSIEAMGRDLKAVLDALDVPGPVVLIGHSMGGMAVLAFAAEFPEEMRGRVAGVVLANTAAAELLKGMVSAVGARTGAVLLAALRRLGSDPVRVHRIRARAFAKQADVAFLIAMLTNFGPKAPPSVVDHVVALAAATPVEVWTDGLRSLLEMDLSHALQHVTAPSLVLVGDRDRLTPPASALAIKRRLPDARMVVLQGAGHCMMLERSEQWNRVVEEFAATAVARWRDSRSAGSKGRGRKRQRTSA